MLVQVTAFAGHSGPLPPVLNKEIGAVSTAWTERQEIGNHSGYLQYSNGHQSEIVNTTGDGFSKSR